VQPLLRCLQAAQLPQVPLALHHDCALKHNQHAQREDGVVPATAAAAAADYVVANSKVRASHDTFTHLHDCLAV
jgi:hypothetical protein